MVYVPPTRNQIYEALFALTAGVTWLTPAPPATRTFITRSRRVKLFSDVGALQQPAIYQAEHAETIAEKSNLPYRRIFECKWIVYQRTGADKITAGAVENDQILDALQLAIQPKVADAGFPNRNTLGGLVYHCFFEGSIFKDPGDIDDQGMMVIPVRLLVP